MIIMNRTDENLVSAKSIDETELCSKIQRLMCNIKHHYRIEHPVFKESNPYINEPKNSFMTNGNNFFTETYCNSEIGEIPSTSLLNGFENEINHENDKNHSFSTSTSTLMENWKIHTSNSKTDNLNSQNLRCVNFVPQRILEKILVLEKLILKFDDSISGKSIPNHKIKLKLMNLLKKFNNVKSKLERVSSNEFLGSEILELMKQLKKLFENFNQIQNEFVVNSLTVKDFEIDSEPNQSIKVQVNKHPVIPPRKFNRANVYKEICHISNVTSSSEDLVSSTNPEVNYQNSKPNFLINLKTRINLFKPLINDCEANSHGTIICGTKFTDEINDFEKSSASMFNKNEINSERKEIMNHTNDILQNVSCRIKFKDSKSEKLFQKNFLSLDVLPTNNNFEKASNKELHKLTEQSFNVKPKIRTRFCKSTSNLFQQNDWHNISSRLPILKKESVDKNAILKTYEISSITKAIKDQVINNLKQMGYLVENEPQDKRIISKKCKLKFSNKLSKDKTKVERIKNFEEIPKLSSDSVYLTKLNSYHCKSLIDDFATNKNSNNSHSRIYNLEKLLKRGKYKFIDCNKLRSKEKLKGSNESFESLTNENKNKFDKNLQVILSLLGNSSKIIHQIIFFPSTSIDINTNEKIDKVPRLANIENICSCQIRILIKEELNKKQLQPIKNLLVFEINYDLRKGKALGCINMLRHLAGQRNKEIKIYRTSLLLPNGYLKEMTCCSINELLNLSMHTMENLKSQNCQRKEHFNTDNQNNKVKLKFSSIKQKPKIIKTFSMGCIASS